MSVKAERGSGTRALLGLAAAVVIVAGMKAAAAILVPFLLAAFIAIIVTPFFIGMQRRGVPSVAALLILVVVLLVVGFLFVGLIGKSLNEFTRKLPAYQQRLQEQTEGLMGWLEERGLLAWLEEKGIGISSESSQEKQAGPEPGTPGEGEAPPEPIDQRPIEGERGTVAESEAISGEEDRRGVTALIYENLNAERVMQFFGDFATALSALLSRFFLILIIVIFMLFEAAILPEKVRKLPGMSEETWKGLGEAVENVRHYMALKTIMSLLTGVLVFVFLVVMDIDFALLLGCLAFLLNFVPNIGSFIAGIPGVLLALVQFGVGTSIVVAIGYVVINTLVGNVLEPRFMGKGLGLSPLIILISLIFWGWVLGPVGMLLSVPLTVAAKLVLDSAEETRWIAVLMGSTPAEKKRSPSRRSRKSPSGEPTG